MPALETKSREEAMKSLEAYLSCGAFTGITVKDGTYKLYPRIKDKQVFIQCVLQKGGKIDSAWGEENAK